MERMRTADGALDVLTDAQRTMMARVLGEEEARREHVVVYLSGAHAYGFPSPDSDLDLKAIHVAKTADLLGFEMPSATVDRAEILEGVEIDYTSNELAHALSGMLGGNGNFLERVLGRLVPHASPRLRERRPRAQCPTRRHRRAVGARSWTRTTDRPGCRATSGCRSSGRALRRRLQPRTWASTPCPSRAGSRSSRLSGRRGAG